MKNRWGKGDPVNLSDLLKITPVANEIMQLSEELNMTTTDLMWIVNQIIDNSDDDNPNFDKILGEDIGEASNEEDWNDIELENLEDSIRQGQYVVNIKITSRGRFPEIGFKAGINDREDINYFFDMVAEMLDKLE
ncbi:MAG TPA: hypothetical protein VN426_02570 [Syntrophomonadaceae bacterium]|nr:hypothetical protein [Syntrophomonadaceae bacterium]